MPINSLQQQAFKNSVEFRNQVDAEVKKQALDFAEDPSNDTFQRDTLGQVAKEPDRYFFSSTIIGDYDWTVTYDPWSDNRASADGAIQTFVSKWFGLLTGYWPTP